MYHLEGFQVITANLIGDIAGAASGAFVNDIYYPVGIGALAVDERKGYGEATARGITEEVVISYARAAIGEPPAFHMVEGNPLAEGALAAPLHIGFIIFKRHFPMPSFLVSLSLKSRVYRDS
jgi:hypothetical protein